MLTRVRLVASQSHRNLALAEAEHGCVNHFSWIQLPEIMTAEATDTRSL